MSASSFFHGIRQSRATLPEGELLVPALYRDGEQMTGIFPARLSALRRLLPDPRFNPARLAPGVGAVTITCFEYRDTDLGPYNELAIAIPLNEPYFRPNLPGRALLDSLRRGQFDSWVQHLPVTTALACAAGREFYNYPKFLAAIDYEQTAETRSCRLAQDGEHILTLRASCKAGRGTEDLQLFNHLYQNREPQSSEFKLRAHQMRRSLKPGAATLELGGDHVIARELDGLLLSRRSIAFAYAPRIEGILYGPHHLTPGLVARLTEAPESHAVAV